MRIEKAYFKGTHIHSFRQGERSEILGVKIVTPDDPCKTRPCFHVKYEDGVEDYVPIADWNNYDVGLKTKI